MPGFFNEEPPMLHEVFVPPLPACIDVLRTKGEDLAAEHKEYGIAVAAMTMSLEESQIWVYGAMLGSIGAILSLLAGFGRCLNEAEDEEDAARVGKFFTMALSVVMTGGDVALAEQRGVSQGLYTTIEEYDSAVYTFSAGTGTVLRDIKSYVSIMRRAGEMGPLDPFPALESCGAACDATGDNWVCAASAPLQRIAVMLLNMIEQTSMRLHKAHKRTGDKFTDAVLYKPIQAVWTGMPIRDILRAVREGTRL